MQIKEDFSHIGRFKRIRCTAVYGKQPMEIQKRELRQRVHVVVGTPGRTFDHMERQNLELEEIRYLVIDEADKMLDMGFIEQVEARGIHIDDVTHVINYEVPMENESYVHRIGRTGRVENKGTAITLASPGELRFLRDIEEYIRYKIPRKELPTEAEVQKGRAAFESKIKSKPKAKKNKAEVLNREITKIRINAGKTKKMRPGDILGAISNIKGVNPEDIGIIDV